MTSINDTKKPKYPTKNCFTFASNIL